MKKRVLALVLSSAMVLAGVVGCSASTEEAAPAEEATTEAPAEEAEAPAGDLTIGISVDFSFASRLATVKGLEQAGEAAGVDMIEMEANGDAQKQNDQINELINKGVDGLLICPVDLNTIKSALMAAEEAKIPVALYDRDSPDATNVITAVTCGATDDGYVGGKYIADELAKQGLDKYVIAELRGPANDDIGVQRSAGFNKAIEEVLGDKAEVLVVETGAWEADVATANLSAKLQSNPEICAVFCGTDSFFPGVETALSEVGKQFKVGEEGHVVVTGINGERAAYDAITANIADGTVVMNCPTTGVKTMEALLAFINDGTKPERTIIVPSTFYTIADIEENKDNIWGCWPQEDLALSYNK